MMDTDGTIIPRTPLSEHQIHNVYSGNHLDIPHKLNSHRHDAAGDDPEVIKGFNAERGAPQGDGPSPLVFVAIMDILLRALQLAHERQLMTPDGTTVSSFHLPGGNGTTYRVNNLAFADDLCTPTQSPYELQAKANIISAFCAVFQIKLNPDKMRAFFTPRDITSAYQLTIYNSKWEPTLISPKGGNEMPYLGSVYEDNYTGKSELKRM